MSSVDKKEETVWRTVGLGAAVAAVAIIALLLVVCAREGMFSKKGSNEEVSEGMKAEAQEELNKVKLSDWGTGLKNRQLSRQYADLENLKEYDDYNEVAQYSALEPEVFKSHSEYTTDLQASTSGASMMSVRSDPNDVNRWIGLRRPDYHSVWAAPDARVDHSEFPDQQATTTRYLL